MDESKETPSVEVSDGRDSGESEAVDFERRVGAMIEACDRFDQWKERLEPGELPSVATLVRRATDVDADRRRRARALASLGLVPDPEAALALEWYASGGERAGRLERLAEVARIEWEMRYASAGDEAESSSDAVA